MSLPIYIYIFPFVQHKSRNQLFFFQSIFHSIENRKSKRNDRRPDKSITTKSNLDIIIFFYSYFYYNDSRLYIYIIYLITVYYYILSRSFSVSQSTIYIYIYNTRNFNDRRTNEMGKKKKPRKEIRKQNKSNLISQAFYRMQFIYIYLCMYMYK